MTAVFVDTMGWFSLLNSRDQWHQQATACMAKFSARQVPLITTDYVMDETSTLLKIRNASHLLDPFLSLPDESQALTLTFITPNRYQDTRQFFLKHRDQGYSFTDVSSFIVMKELRLDQAFTHDKHFEQAGFERLLK